MNKYVLWLALAASLFGFPHTARAQSKPLRIMPLGDSITFGTRSSDGAGYRKALYDKLTAAGLTIANTETAPGTPYATQSQSAIYTIHK